MGFRRWEAGEPVGLSMVDPVMFNSLRRFRAGVYGAFGARRDALFELLDAATIAGLVPSLAHLSLTAADLRAGHQRLAARRRGDQPGAWLPLFGVAAVGRPADRRRLVVRVARAGELHPR